MRIYRRKAMIAAFAALLVSWQIAAQDDGKSAVKNKDTAGLPVSPSGPDEEIVTRTAEEGMAADSFRLGVMAYYRGAFSDAAILFEKSLAYKSDDNLILDWLAKAYYRAGQEGEALAAWQVVLDNGYAGQGIAIADSPNLTLQGKIETLRTRRLTGREGSLLSRYTQSGTYQGIIAAANDDAVKDKAKEEEAGGIMGILGKFKKKPPEKPGTVIFREPAGVASLKDGTLWVVAYGSNELLHLNANGSVFGRVTGPLGGLDRPLDLIRLRNGNLLVSESAGDCLALFDSKGKFIKRIGEKGRGVGQLVGPQYLAEDENGNIYVSDYGNRRVAVFDNEGTGLFTLGQVKYQKDTADGERKEFNGLKGPTGIAILGEGSDTRLFVADDVTGGVYEFDRSGNFVRVLVEEGTFSHPESLKVWDDVLVVCDINRVCSIESGTGAVTERARIGNGPTRAISAVCDANNNMLVSDIKGEEVLVLSDMSEVLGSLFTQIERVHSENFPNITLEVRVEDRHRRAIVGLREENFHITENGAPVAMQTLRAAANNNTVSDLCIVIDRSNAMAEYEDEVAQAVHEIAQGMAGGTLHVICAGAMPTEEYVGTPGAMRSFKTEAIRTSYCDEVPMDAALRLAAGNLINGEKKRAIILVTAGNSNHSYNDYNLSQVSSYLNNNAIALCAVNTAQTALNEETDYMVNSTEGISYYVFRPDGLTGIANDIIGIPNGLYEITYTSGQSTNLGEAYLRVEAEAYLLKRSGRDEGGYFAPLQ